MDGFVPSGLKYVINVSESMKHFIFGAQYLSINNHCRLVYTIQIHISELNGYCINHAELPLTIYIGPPTHGTFLSCR